MLINNPSLNRNRNTYNSGMVIMDSLQEIFYVIRSDRNVSPNESAQTSYNIDAIAPMRVL